MIVRTTVYSAVLVVAVVLAILLVATFGHTPRASAGPQTITICKVTSPPGGTGFPFNWTAGSSGAQPGFSLDDGGVSVPNGQCEILDVTLLDKFNTITEVVPLGWTLTNIACLAGTSPVSFTGSNPNSSFQNGADTLVIDLNEANRTCTFTNTCSPAPCATFSPSPTPTCTPGVICTPTPSPTPTPTATPTPTPTPTPTFTPTDTPTSTPTPTCTPGVICTPTPTPTPCPAPATCTPTPTPCPVGANCTPTPTPTPCPPAVCTPTPTPTLTATPTPTLTPQPQDITICKVTNPASTTAFTFNWSMGTQGPQTPFTLTNGQCMTFPGGGVFTFTEVVPAGWTLTNIVCVYATSYVAIGGGVGPNLAFDPGDTTVTIDLNEPHVTCTFTNVEVPSGSVTICKETNPPGGSGFTFNWTSPTIHTIPYIVNDGDCFPYAGLDPAQGPYSFSEIAPLPPGWQLTNIVCNPSTNVVIGATGQYDPGDTGLTVNLASGDNITCTFTNTLISDVGVTICKHTDPPGGTGFPFNYSNAGGPQPQFTLDDGDCQTFPGTTHMFTELPPPGWYVSNITCNFTTSSVVMSGGTPAGPGFDPGDNTITIALTEPGVTCLVTNARVEKGKITICKQTSPGGGHAYIGLIFPGPWYAGFDLWTTSSAPPAPPYTSQQCYTFSGLDPTLGPYNFHETWALPATSYVANIVCLPGGGILIGSDSNFDPGDISLSITLSPGQHVVCTFVNVLPGSPVPDPWGNTDCDYATTGLDALRLLHELTHTAQAKAGCRDIGTPVAVTWGSQTDTILFGDSDCSGVVDVDDVLATLAYFAGLPRPHSDVCPDVGSLVMG